MSPASKRICGPAKDLFKLTDSTRSDDVRKHSLRTNLLESLRANLDTGKSQVPYNLVKKCTFFLIGFDQNDMRAGTCNFQSQPWKAGACTNVDQSTVFHRE